MRWLVFLFVVLLAAWYFMEDPEPLPIEETFIADQAAALEKAENMEQEYLDSVKAQQDRLEEQLEGGTGDD